MKFLFIKSSDKGFTTYYKLCQDIYQRESKFTRKKGIHPALDKPEGYSKLIPILKS
jgi:hypothetical protein